MKALRNRIKRVRRSAAYSTFLGSLWALITYSFLAYAVLSLAVGCQSNVVEPEDCDDTPVNRPYVNECGNTGRPNE
jgi:hypothetical protein